MTILFDGRFANGATFATYNRVDRNPQSADNPPLASGRPGEYELVPDPLGSGELVAKLTMAAANPGRMELRPFVTDFSGSNPDWGTRWYALWLMIPPSPEWQLPPASGVDVDSSLAANNRTLIMQLHETEDAGEAHFPGFQIAIDQNGYVVMLTHDTADPTVGRVPNLRVLRNLSPIVRGFWDLWALKIRYACDSNGLIELYRNRRCIFAVSGVPTGFNDAVGPFMKFGQYAYSLDSWTSSRTLYTKGMVIGDENSSHLEVTGVSALERAAGRGLVL